jgi:hypothetical protein
MAFVLCPAMFAQQTQGPLDPENIESMFSIGVFSWRPDHGRPVFRGGKPNRDPSIRDLDYPADLNPRSFGGVITFPAKGFTRLEVGFFRVTGDGSVRAPRNISLEGANIVAGELLAMKYQISNYRLSWNYLTYPWPPLDSRFRIKTFWEVQYTQMKPEVRLPETDPNRAIQPDQGVFFPGAGLGFEYVPAQAFRIEARGSGMGFPGKSRYLDTEATAVVRLGGLELFGGAKLFHFQTPPKNEVFLKGTLWGPLFGVRYVFPK